MKKISYTILIFLISLSPISLLAWSMTGHRVIAEIAQRNIKPETAEKINTLLDNLPMAYWANWPDFIKSDKTGKWDHTYIWHFINAPGDLSYDNYVKAIKDVKQENVYSEIPKLITTIQNQDSSDEDKRIALIFLIHLVGDAHQPMHVGREEDLGGNKVSVNWFSDATNLHAVWDGKLIDYEKYSYTEYTDILNTTSDDTKSLFKQGTLELWLYETYLIANEIYSSVNYGDKLMFEYSYKYKSVVESQLLKGGMRLATVLDMAFN